MVGLLRLGFGRSRDLGGDIERLEKIIASIESSVNQTRLRAGCPRFHPAWTTHPAEGIMSVGMPFFSRTSRLSIILSSLSSALRHSLSSFVVIFSPHAPEVAHAFLQHRWTGRLPRSLLPPAAGASRSGPGHEVDRPEEVLRAARPAANGKDLRAVGAQGGSQPGRPLPLLVRQLRGGAGLPEPGQRGPGCPVAGDKRPGALDV